MSEGEGGGGRGRGRVFRCRFSRAARCWHPSRLPHALTVEGGHQWTAGLCPTQSVCALGLPSRAQYAPRHSALLSVAPQGGSGAPCLLCLNAEVEGQEGKRVTGRGRERERDGEREREREKQRSSERHNERRPAYEQVVA